MKNFHFHVMKVLSIPWRVLRWMMLTRPIRFTRFGTFYILFCIGVGAAAINTGNNLLYLILGILLGFIVISGILSDSGLWGITAEWIPDNSLFVGKRTSFTCRVSKGWFPGVAVTLESHWQDQPPVRSFFPWISARGTALAHVGVMPARRGYLALERCVALTRFPFGLFQKSRSWRSDERWVVYPRVERLPRTWIESAGDAFSPAASNRQGLGSAPYLLRDYRAGDALRRVQWKVSAKRQRLIVKETEEESDHGDYFYLNAWPKTLTASEMEDFISFMASLILTAHDTGRPVGLSTPERVFLPRNSRSHLERIFHFLALIDPFDRRETAERPRRRTPGARSVAPRTLDVLTFWKTYAAQR